MKFFIPLAATAAFAGGLAAVPAPALAQQTGGNQSEVVVYGSDPCPRSTESNIVVCVHRPETERYRLPKSQQLQGTRQERQSWANRTRELSNTGKTGINSCSPVGPAGHTGCLIQEINQARRENGQNAEDNSTPPQ
jgi:hypothetical protein